jgi:hypothetical protein
LPTTKDADAHARYEATKSALARRPHRDKEGLEMSRDLIRRELEAIAQDDARSGRARLAKVTALTLERLEREQEGLSEAEKHLWDESRNPEAIVDAHEWHPHPDEFAALENRSKRSPSAAASGCASEKGRL